MYQMLSQSVRFCRLYTKKHFGVFFGSQCIYKQLKQMLNKPRSKRSEWINKALMKQQFAVSAAIFMYAFAIFLVSN